MRLQIPFFNYTTSLCYCVCFALLDCEYVLIFYYEYKINRMKTLPLAYLDTLRKRCKRTTSHQVA